MFSNSSLDMLNESLTFIICKTVRYFDNNVYYISIAFVYTP